MKRIISLHFLLPLMLFLISCASSVQQNYTGEDSTILFFSFDVKNDAPQGSFYIYLRHKETGKEYKYKFIKGYSFVDDTPDFSDDDSSGIVFADRVKQGEYEIFKVGMQAKSAHLHFSSDWKGSVSLSMDGEVSYLGSFVFAGVPGDYPIGTFKGNDYHNLNGAVNITLDVVDERDRDAAIAYKKYDFIRKKVRKNKQLDPASLAKR